MNPLYSVVSVRAAARCEYCRAPEQVFNFAFEVEHIQPRSGGGDDRFNNLALSCESCNSFKSNFMTGWDAEEEKECPLFHTRRDLWNEHFVFDDATAEVRGLTPTGRATVTRLKINSPFQIRARRQWRTLGLYP